MSQGDTGLTFPSTQRLDYRTGNLSRKRDAILDDFPSIPEINLTTFTESFLPPLPSGVNTTTIFGLLYKSQCIREGQEGLYWDVFGTIPAKSAVAEGATFDKLMEIYNAVIEQSGITREMPTAQLSLNPNKAPFSNRTHHTRPDGYMILTAPCIPDYVENRWEDLAVTMEFKETNKDFIDNMKKQIFSMQQLMTYDPCRRFTFGLTIENTDVRLWFCSRSMLAASEIFDLNKDPEPLIVAFLSFTYASKADLGWDETMKPKIVLGKTQYEIKVGNNTYETQGDPLSEFVAHSIVGRATRVYKVKKLLDNAEQTYVLKDVWLAKGRRPEHTIREEILEDIKEVLGENDKSKVEKHLFTPVDHCIVQVETKDKGRVNDDTHDVILRKAEFSTANPINIMRAVENLNYVVESKGQTPHLSEYVATRAPPVHKDITHRYHYRIVFKELAVPLYGLDQVSSIFHLFYELVQVLDIFHRSGWVHRDLSSGNVFLYQNEYFKLGDLEFAKKMGKDGEHDVRTGTLDFMSFEVERQKYMYLPNHQERLDFFYHNSLHELESVWWLVTWCLFFHCPSKRALKDPNGQRDALDALFPRRLDNINRFELFTEKGNFHNVVQYLQSDLHDIGTEVDRLRINLVDAYYSFEARLLDQDAPVQVQNFSQNRLNDIHSVFISKFKDIWTKYKAEDIKLVRLHSLKREHSVTEDSPETKRLKSDKKVREEYRNAIMELLRRGVEPSELSTRV